MTDAEIVSTYTELVREAKHKSMWIEVDDFRHEFLVYDFTEKPAKLVGKCTSIQELASIINDYWYDPLTNKWHSNSTSSDS